MATRFPIVGGLIPLFVACSLASQAYPRSVKPPYRPADSVTIAQRINGTHYYRGTLGALVDLPRLAAQRLPPGHRELRIDIGCGLCSPVYLVRISEAPRNRIAGEAFASWGGADTLAAVHADSAERRRLARIAREDREWEQAWCAERARRQPLPQVPTYLNVWCRLRTAPNLDWSALLARLDSVGAFAIGMDTGYVAMPLGFVTTDTISGQVRLAFGGGCLDIGSHELSVESLVGTVYRNAMSFCLERPRGEEATRLAELRRIALSAIPPLRRPK
jgi:hypothetical protein